MPLTEQHALANNEALGGGSGLTVWTIGHSTHTFEAFLALVAVHGIDLLADIRAVPRSRRHPHFDQTVLERTVPEHGIVYVHLPRLGGWRRPAPESPNGGWRNRSFRGYADYAMGQEFAAGLTELRALAASRRTAAMCSEAQWWRCHRRLVADRLVVAGDVVFHIGSDGRASQHHVTSFAKVSAEGPITYPPAP
jgi:uncharacterized protein (DUF488 family)